MTMKYAKVIAVAVAATRSEPHIMLLSRELADSNIFLSIVYSCKHSSDFSVARTINYGYAGSVTQRWKS